MTKDINLQHAVLAECDWEPRVKLVHTRVIDHDGIAAEHDRGLV